MKSLRENRRAPGRTAILAVLVAAALAGVSGCRTVRRPLQKEDHSCGMYRWRVKTLTDPDVGGIRLEPIDTTIHDLVRLHRSRPARRRRRVEELSVYRVKAVVFAIHSKLDKDLHLRLRNPDDPRARLIAEIPNPECTRSSPYGSAFAAAREAAESLKARGGETLVEVEGVGFFDVPHLQIGKARNGLELHPVLKLTEIPSNGGPGSDAGVE